MRFSDQLKLIWLPILIATAASFWMLTSLGNGMLWQDEAQTALLGRTTLQHGVPIAFDGPNSISQEQGDDYGPRGLWKWHMWLPFYVLAGFFKVFGESTTIARLPFAIFGIATVVLVYFASLRWWGDIKTALLSAVLMLLCIPFELLCRQCRYYSPCMFFTLLMLHSYLRIIQGNRQNSARKVWMLAISATLLFNCHFIYTATMFAAIGIHVLIWRRSNWKAVFLAAAITAVLCLPPTLWLASLKYRNYSGTVLTPQAMQFQLSKYIKGVFLHIIPYPFLAVPILIGMVSAIRKRGFFPSLAQLEPWAIPVVFTTITILVATPFTPYPFFRYLGPAIAPLLILVARWVVVGFRANLFVGTGALILLAYWWPLHAYVYELSHEHVGPIEGIVQLLKAESNPGDKVLITYEDLPLKFYTSLRVFGGLAGDDLSKAQDARWVIARHRQISDKEAPTWELISKMQHDHPDFKRRVLNVPDTPFENREEPEEHYYATIQNAPPLVVYDFPRAKPSK